MRPFLLSLCLSATLLLAPVLAQTYVSVEPIPSQDIVGAQNLANIEALGYPVMELWAQRLLNDCHFVQNTITVLALNRAITTVYPGNTRYLVAAGGFQGVTDPTYVLTMQDIGLLPASQADIFTLDNALGYVLNQGGTAQFSRVFDKNNPYTFANQYAVITYGGALTGEQAQQFFNYLGTIDVNLWTGTDAGFTQVNFSNTPLINYALDDSMLFLIGSVSTQEFTSGLFQAATTTPNMTYFPLVNGKPTVATAGAAFPGNDWVADPGGQGYLSNIPNASPQLLNELSGLRQQHLQAVSNLLSAIASGNVSNYLNDQFSCPSLKLSD